MTAKLPLAQFPEKLEFLFEPHRYKVLYGGRGGTKSWGIARALLIIGSMHPLRVLCAREYQNSMRDSVHRLLKDQIEELQLDHVYDVQDKVIRGPDGTEFSFEGLRHNVKRIKSYEGVDVAWVEEAENVSKSSWDVLIPTIRKSGSEIWISFNPEFEDDETYLRFVVKPPSRSKVVEVNWRDNPWFPTELEQERLELKDRDPDAYDHVWEGRCRRWLAGAIYANELRAAFEEGRIALVPHDPSVPVFTAWDLGHTDDTAIWWYQMVRDEVHIIDSYARSGGSLSDYATQITGREITIDIVDREIRVTEGQWLPELAHRREYRYERHALPHDAKAKVLAAGGKSTQEQLAAVFGWGKIRIVPSLRLEDGIQVARTVFGRCWFDKERTEDGVRALRRYRREAQPDEKSLKKNPVHDWSSHYSDGFRYLAIACQAPYESVPEPPAELDAWGRPIVDEDWKVAM